MVKVEKDMGSPHKHKVPDMFPLLMQVVEESVIKTKWENS